MKGTVTVQLALPLAMPAGKNEGRKSWERKEAADELLMRIKFMIRL